MYRSNKFNGKIFGSRYNRIFLFKHSFTRVYLIYDIYGLAPQVFKVSVSAEPHQQGGDGAGQKYP